MASVELISSIFTAPTEVRVLCSAVTISGSKKNTSEPNVSGNSPVEVHTQGEENLLYTLNNIYFDPDTILDILTYKNVLEMYRHRYTGSNQILLRIIYDDGTPLLGSDTVTTDIPVVLESFTKNLDASDSKNARKPIGTLVLKETL